MGTNRSEQTVATGTQCSHAIPASSQVWMRHCPTWTPLTPMNRLCPADLRAVVVSVSSLTPSPSSPPHCYVPPTYTSGPVQRSSVWEPSQAELLLWIFFALTLTLQRRSPGVPTASQELPSARADGELMHGYPNPSRVGGDNWSMLTLSIRLSSGISSSCPQR